MKYRPRGGWLHVVYGCMFAGKTEALVSEAVRARISGRTVLAFKPEIDQRGEESRGRLTTHSGAYLPAIEIPCGEPEKIVDWMAGWLEDVNQRLPNPEDVFIYIDEVQFFSSGIVEVVKELLKQKCNLVIGGLATDFRGEPFGCMPELLTIANSSEQLYAVCQVCGEPFATRTQRLHKDGTPARFDEQQVLVGDTDIYQARCHKCHSLPL